MNTEERSYTGKDKQCVPTMPAAGNRNYNDGSLNNAGGNGNYWSSTVNGTNAYNLNFNGGNVNPNNNTCLSLKKVDS